ncbi:Uncharacterised protein [Mycobacterium tuberculosis]|nr:Uncharacterised protein [Mycobacterium tuberculosis]
MAIASRYAAYGTNPPAWLRMNRMFGYLRRIPLRTNRYAARVVSSRKSAANGTTPSTAGPGSSAGWMNATAERASSAASKSS